ncbi:hypothetical protein FB567DRAFT_274905 [Paraphoma chrysanthemicola]|uniref:Apple domain-containing protein n=1 Tax=Paraphoma chrysanthemicola TaxID=798071 RepID=A0A8K0RAI5_9PLEO|nr:hypothetical protein FB567DRAFT_274905 [Paraphoma chrysanthemicola]
MLLTISIALLASASTSVMAADVPSCARRAAYNASSPTLSQALLQPVLQIDGNRCANICRLLPSCGGFASSANKLPTDWCLIFKQDATFESIFGSGIQLLDGTGGFPVSYWDVACFRPST